MDCVDDACAEGAIMFKASLSTEVCATLRAGDAQSRAKTQVCKVPPKCVKYISEASRSVKSALRPEVCKLPEVCGKTRRVWLHAARRRDTSLLKGDG
eukprot:6199931-Pleurochrysis_carterae.AAC.2